MLRTVACIALMAFCTPLLAQAPADSAKPHADRRFDCSKAKDPKACEERVAKAKAARDKARQACAGKKGDEGRDCMRREMCAQTKDPAKCEAQVKEAAARRAQIREACKDRKDEELKSCIREQLQKK
jgi:Spy/CpxP family protein refolding chaperone